MKKRLTNLRGSFWKIKPELSAFSMNRNRKDRSVFLFYFYTTKIVTGVSISRNLIFLLQNSNLRFLCV